MADDVLDAFGLAEKLRVGALDRRVFEEATRNDRHGTEGRRAAGWGTMTLWRSPLFRVTFSWQ